jgi:hypothetical protein
VKAHLEQLQERRRQRRGGVAMVMEQGTVEEVNSEDEQFAFLCCERAMEDFHNTFGDTDNFAAAVAFLNVHDYLQRDADALFESTFLSL